jgi:hypothetical protein
VLVGPRTEIIWGFIIYGLKFFDPLYLDLSLEQTRHKTRPNQ